jgi:hypothetical protein
MDNEEKNTERKNTMSKKIIGFFEHLKTYISYYVAMTTVLGGLWGVFVMYDNWRDNNKILQENVKSIIEKQNLQTKRDSILLENQQEIRIELDYVKINTENSLDQIKALQKSYIRYISNDDALTKAQFLEYMEGLSVESKKN